jgi:16S rRNA (adenine1518-N6/adenine1519-N6)-dimethyltransferase
MSNAPTPPRHQPRKRFGQNFLRDEAIIDRIAAAIAPAAEDHLVEIGPGLGALTEALLPSGCRLDAVELDRDLATPLLAAFSIYPRFTLHRADALSFDFGALAAPGDTLRIVGNLPYNISTPLIFRLLEASSAIRDMHFMLQLEVVQRLTATPGGRHWGRLGIMAQYHCTAELLFEVPPEAFDPPPKVQSAIVRLTPHRASPWPDCDAAALARIVKAAFAQRRKTLRNNLRGIADDAQLADCGIDPGARAETLSLAQYVALAAHLAQ